MGMTTSNTDRDMTPRANSAHLKNRPKNRADVGNIFQTPEVGETISPAPGSNGTRMVDTVAHNEEIEIATPAGPYNEDDERAVIDPQDKTDRNDSTGTAGISGIKMIGPQVVLSENVVLSQKGKKK